MKIAILNYNIGNLASIKNALLSIGVESCIISKSEDIRKFDRLILPGVGAFGDAIRHLDTSGMSAAIRDFAKSGKYILGICLGMQLLFDKSYEFGEFSGLALLRGEVEKFESETLKIPHIGWNRIEILRDSALLRGVKNGEFCYFVHSFFVKQTADTIATCDYGTRFSAVVQKDNIFGIQAHPEKSADSGLKILENFTKLA